MALPDHPAHTPVWIEITSTPAGEAPRNVRDGWIGITLFAPFGLETDVLGHGVLSGPRSWLGLFWARITNAATTHHGYQVNAAEAFALLAAHDVTAAKWWVDHAPHLVHENQGLVFDATCCREVPPPRPWAANTDAIPTFVLRLHHRFNASSSSAFDVTQSAPCAVISRFQNGARDLR